MLLLSHNIATLALLLRGTMAALHARQATTTSSAGLDWCQVGGFVNQINSGPQFCCPGRLIHNDELEYACCVGNFSPTSSRATTFTSPGTGTVTEYFYATPTSCSSTVQVTDSAYASRVSAAATEYGITYTRSSSTYTVGREQQTGTSTTSGGAAAMVTKAPMAGAALAMVGGLMMAV